MLASQAYKTAFLLVDCFKNASSQTFREDNLLRVRNLLSDSRDLQDYLFARVIHRKNNYIQFL